MLSSGGPLSCDEHQFARQIHVATSYLGYPPHFAALRHTAVHGLPCSPCPGGMSHKGHPALQLCHVACQLLHLCYSHLLLAAEHASDVLIDRHAAGAGQVVLRQPLHDNCCWPHVQAGPAGLPRPLYLAVIALVTCWHPLQQMPLYLACCSLHNRFWSRDLAAWQTSAGLHLCCSGHTGQLVHHQEFSTCRTSQMLALSR